jgi:hypothetical protein
MIRNKKPGFLIIGAQKCGTTSLFHYLSQHPDLNLPVTKEIHFFDLQYEKGIDWYESKFPSADTSCEKITGEASPYYLFHPLVPERVATHFPTIKLIVMLRNPVDRAYSHFMHQRKLNEEPIDLFETAIAMEDVRTTGEEEKLKFGLVDESLPHRRHSYVNRGYYYEQIKRWLKYFPMSQLLFVKSEELFQHPTKVLEEIYIFLNISRIMPSNLKPKNTNTYPEMLDDTRINLNIKFNEDSRKLKELLGAKFSWL